MGKELLLTKSNFRKNKGTSIGLLLLMLLSSALIGLVLLVVTDAYPMAEREAKRLDSGDACIMITGDIDDIDDMFLEKVFADNVKRFNMYECLKFNPASLKYGDGQISINLLVNDSSAFSKDMDRTEIVIEDSTIKEDYLYLPYQYYTSGGFRLGDDYSIELDGVKYDLKIKGFTNTTNFGCNNNGAIEIVFDDVNYAKLKEKSYDKVKAKIVNYELNDGVDARKTKIRFTNEISDAGDNVDTIIMLLDDTIFGKTFMSLILVVCFLIVTVIMILVVMLMLVNCVANYIKENFKTIGALKAIGYTASNVKLSLHLMFISIALIGSALGVCLAYVCMPVVSKIVVGQMGLPYKASFNLIAWVGPIAFIIIFVLLVSVFAARKIGKIQPIVALRDGVETHNFKKNRVRLDESKLSLNVSLAFKNLFTNIKQNIITFIVTGLLVFACTIGLLLFENFCRHPKIDILTFETCAGVIGADDEVADEVYEYLSNMEGVTNIRRMVGYQLSYKDEDVIYANVFDDISKMNNKNVCYKGRLPEHDNEIAVSGKFAKDFGFEIGDKVELHLGNRSYDYLITGFVQSCNNAGREAAMTFDAIKHIYVNDEMPGFFWFDLTKEFGQNKESAQKVIEEIESKYGDKINSGLNFYEIMEGSLTTFKTISTVMLVFISFVAAVVIMLILYLLIKAFIYNKRKDFGIYKALGYTSRDLILQTAISFMPAIVLSVIVFGVVSYFAASVFVTKVMGVFGIMKCSFPIPILGLVIVGVSMIILSFAIAVWQARKIKNIEAYNMLVGE